MVVHMTNFHTDIRAAPASSTSTSPTSGTQDSNIAGGPYFASRMLARRARPPCGGRTATAARANQYVVQAPSVFPAVATMTGTTHPPELLMTNARGTSEDSGRIVEAAKLQANRTTRLRKPSAQ